MMNKKRNSGMSMVELMIAMVIGVILLGGAATMFITNKRIYKEQAEMGLLQENARFALELMANNIRMAGYVGCQDNINNISNLLPGPPAALDFSNGFITGTEGLGASDSITVRYFQPFNMTTTTDMSTASSKIAITNGNGINQSLVMAITDCANADIFRVSNTDAATTNELEHTTTGSLNTSNDLSKAYLADSQINRVISRRYFIQGSLNGTGPALWWNAAGVDEELVEGVQRMELKFGIDTSGNGSPDSFVNANAVADWSEIVAVRIALLMRTVEEYGTIVDNNPYQLFDEPQEPAANDRRRRRLFTTTVQIRNGMVEN